MWPITLIALILAASLGVSSLAVEGDTAIIAAYDEGVVVANLRTKTVQTLRFP